MCGEANVFIETLEVIMNKISTPFHTLQNILHDMCASSHRYVVDPSIHFTRKRKLDLGATLHFAITAGSSSIQSELLDFYANAKETPTTSAYCQQRSKILPSAFYHIFNEVNRAYPCNTHYCNYRLLAVDGSQFQFEYNSKETDCNIQTRKDSKPYSIVHMNAVYDVLAHRYTDAVIQPIRKLDETGAAVDMIRRSNENEKAIYIFDRGYESYNVFAHCNHEEVKYIVRVKDITSNGILSSLALPNEAIDQVVTRTFTRRNTNHIKSHPEIYKYLPKNQRFDFLNDLNEEYQMTYRVVRFLVNDTYEAIITNLDENEFNSDEIKELYGKRWGIESSFRELKYSIGALCLHTKQQKYVEQELLGSLILYNLCRIASDAVDSKKRNRKQQINMKVFIHWIRKQVKRIQLNFDEIDKLYDLAHVMRSIVREGRHSVRKKGTRSNFTSAQYRIN